MTIVTFSNLFPSSVMPQHGLFVRERMQRVAAKSGLSWRVIAPVPTVAWPLRRGIYRDWHAVPAVETWEGIEVLHPRYRHWPGLSLRRQADAVAAGARATVKALAKQGPIVLDAHYVWPDGVAAATLAAEFGVPFVVTARGTDVNVVADDPAVRERIAAMAHRAAALFAVSGALAERFAEVAGVPRERVREVRNGVDLERFRPGDAAAARRELGLPAQGRLLLGVGRLAPGKGFLSAARVLGQLPDDVRLVLVGDGPERAAIQAAGRERALLLGSRPPDQVATAMRAADLFVLPTLREGWPNVVTEALASGLRVVASRVGGIPQILGVTGSDESPAPAQLGALVSPSDDAALLRALREVLAEPSERAAVRAFAERYGWDEPVEFLSGMFRSLLSGVAA